MKRAKRLGIIFVCQMIVGLLLAEAASRVLFRDVSDDEAYLKIAYEAVLNSAVVFEGKADQADATYSLRPSPFADISMSTSEFTYSGKANSLGFRTRELEPRKPGEYRVLLVGDSMFWGVGLNDNETIPAVIERGTKPGVVAYNYSVPGHNTVHEYLTAKAFLDDVKPDHVILGFFIGNDIVPNAVSTIGEDGQFAVDVDTEAAVKRSIRDELGIFYHSVLFRKLSSYGYLSNVRYSIASRPEIMRRSLGMIDRFSELARQHEARFSLVVMYPRDSIGGGFKGWWSNSGSVGNTVASYCRERSIEVLDTAELMSGPSDEARYYYAIDGHYTPAGAEVVGRAILEKIIIPGMQPLTK